MEMYQKDYDQEMKYMKDLNEGNAKRGRKKRQIGDKFTDTMEENR